ncbi:amidohydrolase [Mycolicibacter hiberniae]|uniref:Amidohydrolase n=1 Tax=Mycolicibacter hiberniae TaxID=29314 RepID=A0A7I7X758_9MYCO|nr:amidohydrolase [Mycolicibacter hiberniae]MCV7085026.1 amidohydrolase [Mycolicibacter hiberniae]ORV68663.1 amidohydrolase [Mycolicibacter hiberniae]BBZ25312.1 amidohydrolase [Mycolicibacter hiberniae]
MTGLAERVDDIVAADTRRLVEIFKDLHRHPELGFHEVRTARTVAQALSDLGLTVTTGIGQTGVVAVLANGPGPVVMYRADMDALHVPEATGLDYASSSPELGHMCGHDAHVTWMLGMAKVLAQTTDSWSGTAVLVGQPAEELIAGAAAMVAGGLYDVAPRPDAFLALHTVPLPVGMVAAAGGERMAGTDQLDVVFHGVGGHGSMPQLARDTVLMAAQAVVQFQSIVSRTIAPNETAVLTVGSVQAGGTYNVIPDRALLKVNLRWFNPQVREQMLTGIRAICTGIARSYGMPDDRLPTITMAGGAPPLVNDPALTDRVATALGDLLGESHVLRDLPAGTGSEDCHLLKGPHHEVPLAYLLVGIADPKVYAKCAERGQLFPYAPHSPDYVIDLSAIPAGTRIAARGMLELLTPSRSQ